MKKTNNNDSNSSSSTIINDNDDRFSVVSYISHRHTKAQQVDKFTYFQIIMSKY